MNMFSLLSHEASADVNSASQGKDISVGLQLRLVGLDEVGKGYK